MSAKGLSSRAAQAGLVLSLVLTAACRQDMHDQPKYKPFRASDFYGDGSAMRGQIEGTVAQGQLVTDDAYSYGLDADGVPVSQFPITVDKAVLLRGQERYGIFCAPCHGALGDGQGMVVMRGYKQPPSFHEARLRDTPAGYYFDVMSNGFGQMQSYAAQVPVADRWAIVAYIRVLQLSQGARVTDLPPEAAAKATAAASTTEPTKKDEHANGHV